ncbi:hypothetical protein QCA50_006217 [Cerrena zonata]|uniref:Uncharacterized protein n=1 Tax=Cerrena zonata TaxID=2478898 RepID=A0AAW0GIY0_9APHY
MTLGTVLSVKVADDNSGYQSHSATRLLDSIRATEDNDGSSSLFGGAAFGINYRTLGNVAYFMLSLNTPSETIRAVEQRVWKTLSSTS